MKKILPALCVGLAGLSLAGCDDVYSPNVRYGVRRDPILMVPGGQLADERIDPDPPGQLPLLNVAGIYREGNPLNQPKVTDKIKNDPQGVFRDPAQLAEADRTAMGTVLEEMFGTPAQPRVRGYDAKAKKATELSRDAVDTLKLDDKTLAEGSRLYRIHCVHCHGVPGDGRGPTAQWVNPHPRDFRQGLFKFQSVSQLSGEKGAGANSPPRREDLLRTLEQGLEGSAMPAFTLLTPQNREDLASYVIHLSLRGRAEYDTIKSAFEWNKDKGTLAPRIDEENNQPTDLGEFLAIMNNQNVERWLKSQLPGNKIEPTLNPYAAKSPEALKESVKRGHQMFIGKADDGADEKFQKLVKATNCVSCHTDYGRQAQFRWDDWGTLVRPNNLTNGQYRGGRRPVDIYYRIHSGINGSGMANFGDNLPPEAIWDLVNFVRSLPYPAMRQQFAINVQ